MTNVLVAYGSKHGATAEIAQAVAEKLREHDLSADCLEAGEIGPLEPYDAVVLGSAVYMGRWRGEARHFLRKHARELSQRPFWVFSSGPTEEPSGEPDGDDSRWTEPRRVIEKAESLGVRDHVVFGGRMPTEPHGPVQRGMVERTPPELRDRRDWDAIGAWASGIASELGASAPAGGLATAPPDRL